MNREIEFRGFDGTKWYYGDLEYNRKTDIARIHTYKEDGSYGRQYLVDPDTIGQFAGLVDKNGVKIFEGDWVLLEGVGIFNVRYSTSMCQFGLYGKRGFVDALKELQEDRYVVVGNVYDNPELLATK